MSIFHLIAKELGLEVCAVTIVVVSAAAFCVLTIGSYEWLRGSFGKIGEPVSIPVVPIT